MSIAMSEVVDAERARRASKYQRKQECEACGRYPNQYHYWCGICTANICVDCASLGDGREAYTVVCAECKEGP